MARPVRECKSSKKCLKHFFDTLSLLQEAGACCCLTAAQEADRGAGTGMAHASENGLKNSMQQQHIFHVDWVDPTVIAGVAQGDEGGNVPAGK